MLILPVLQMSLGATLSRKHFCCFAAKRLERLLDMVPLSFVTAGVGYIVLPSSASYFAGVAFEGAP